MGFVQVLLSPTLAHLCSSMAETRAAPRLRGRRGQRRVAFRARLVRATPLISVLARASIDGAPAPAHWHPLTSSRAVTGATGRTPDQTLDGTACRLLSGAGTLQGGAELSGAGVRAAKAILGPLATGRAD